MNLNDKKWLYSLETLYTTKKQQTSILNNKVYFLF